MQPSATNASLEQRIEQLAGKIARLDNALIENRGNMSRCMEARQDEENMHAKVLAEKDAAIARLQKEFANVSRLHGRLREALELAEPLLEERRANLVFSYENIATGELDDEAHRLLLPVEIALGVARRALTEEA